MLLDPTGKLLLVLFSWKQWSGHNKCLQAWRLGLRRVPNSAEVIVVPQGLVPLLERHFQWAITAPSSVPTPHTAGFPAGCTLVLNLENFPSLLGTPNLKVEVWYAQHVVYHRAITLKLFFCVSVHALNVAALHSYCTQWCHHIWHLHIMIWNVIGCVGLHGLIYWSSEKLSHHVLLNIHHYLRLPIVSR